MSRQISDNSGSVGSNRVGIFFALVTLTTVNESKCLDIISNVLVFV